MAQHLSKEQKEGSMNFKQESLSSNQSFRHVLRFGVPQLGGCTPFWDATPDVCVCL